MALFMKVKAVESLDMSCNIQEFWSMPFESAIEENATLTSDYAADLIEDLICRMDVLDPQNSIYL
ncbi:hypothetical protein E2562_029257 [Oryza meyeriana var. granulata]|uniref:Uncharacterized protein n=1 Tax=Oryza meyeriana var. granulata TaxID=110450 RepID=A0A6G1EQX2_9ORYZ|nr:hypothetical protein E2562_029257 [Oryza meyeriana var. granulata]